jgi:hypothetical protein
LAEQQTLNLRVEGSIPSWLTKIPPALCIFLCIPARPPTGAA